jgi:hypothetical protein
MLNPLMRNIYKRNFQRARIYKYSVLKIRNAKELQAAVLKS